MNASAWYDDESETHIIVVFFSINQHSIILCPSDKVSKYVLALSRMLYPVHHPTHYKPVTVLKIYPCHKEAIIYVLQQQGQLVPPLRLRPIVRLLRQLNGGLSRVVQSPASSTQRPHDEAFFRRPMEDRVESLTGVDGNGPSGRASQVTYVLLFFSSGIMSSYYLSSRSSIVALEKNTPSIEPWGQPPWTAHGSLIRLPTLTTIEQSVKKAATILSKLEEAPFLANNSKQSWNDIRLNALE